MGIMGANFPAASQLNAGHVTQQQQASSPSPSSGSNIQSDYNSRSAATDVNSESVQNTTYGSEKNDLEQETKLKIIEILEV